MMFSSFILPVLMSICANRFVGCLPVEHGAEGIGKREPLLYHEEIPRCVINEGGLPVKISPACQHVLHNALFPDEPSVSSTNSDNVPDAAHLPHQTQPFSSTLADGPVHTDEAPLNGVRVITSEEGLYWLWGILGEDCDVLEDLLYTMAVLIADTQETDEPQNWKEIQDVETDSDAVELREVRFHSKRKRDGPTQTTVASFPRAQQGLFNQRLTPTVLARLNGNLPTNPPPGRGK